MLLLANHSREHEWCCVGKQFSDVIFVNRVPHGGSGVMVCAGMRYAQQSSVHFIDGKAYFSDIHLPASLQAAA